MFWINHILFEKCREEGAEILSIFASLVFVFGFDRNGFKHIYNEGLSSQVFFL
jgi:hypothetical protein